MKARVNPPLDFDSVASREPLPAQLWRPWTTFFCQKCPVTPVHITKSLFTFLFSGLGKQRLWRYLARLAPPNFTQSVDHSWTSQRHVDLSIESNPLHLVCESCPYGELGGRDNSSINLKFSHQQRQELFVRSSQIQYSVEPDAWSTGHGRRRHWTLFRNKCRPGRWG